MSLYKETDIAKARKGHTCDICRGDVPKGGSYRRIQYLNDGAFYEAKICSSCLPIFGKFLEIHKDELDDGYVWDFIAEDLRETVRWDCRDRDSCDTNCIRCEEGRKAYLAYERKPFW